MGSPTGTAAAKRKSQRSKTETEELLAPSHPEAKELCLLAQQIAALAPWDWMDEIDVFGVQDPVTGEIGFVSVTGAEGEYRSIAVYLGTEGLGCWLDVRSVIELESEHPDLPMMLLETPHLELSFSESNLFEKRDRDLLKGVGLKFTGARPLFRSSRPGFLSWYLTRAEARVLIHALSQTIIIAERFAQDPNILAVEDDDEEMEFLVRTPHEQGSGLVWEDQIQKISTESLFVFTIETSVLNKLKLIAQGETELEADLFPGPGAVGDRGERPAVLFTLLVADHRSRLVLGVEVMAAAEGGLSAMYSDIPVKLAHMMLDAKLLPKRLILRSDKLWNLLFPLARELNVELFHSDKLPAIKEARNFMFKEIR